MRLAVYIVSLIAYVVMLIVAVLAAPILPAFASMRDGPADNGNKTEIGPRLPRWLAWFDTSTDNSLWGDTGWRTIHCQAHWNDYLGMVLWLWRNPAAGFSWSVLAYTVQPFEVFVATSSGCGLDLDKGRHQQGWFYVLSSFGAFHYRFVKEGGGVQWSFEAGWLLDVYVKDPQAVASKPKALFVFQPGIRRLKNG